MTASATSLTRHGMKMTAPTSTIRSCCRTASRSIPRPASCPGKSMCRRCWASSTAASVTRACSSQALSSRRFSSPWAVSCLLQAWPPRFRRTARPSRPCVPLQSPGKGPRPAARMPGFSLRSFRPIAPPRANRCPCRKPGQRSFLRVQRHRRRKPSLPQADGRSLSARCCRRATPATFSSADFRPRPRCPRDGKAVGEHGW